MAMGRTLDVKSTTKFMLSDAQWILRASKLFHHSEPSQGIDTTEPSENDAQRSDRDFDDERDEVAVTDPAFWSVGDQAWKFRLSLVACLRNIQRTALISGLPSGVEHCNATSCFVRNLSSCPML